MEGPAGLLSCFPPEIANCWNRSLGELSLPNGTQIQTFSGEEPNRLRGPQHHRVWIDELAAMQYAEDILDMMTMGLRLGELPQVVITTTPRPHKYLRALMERPDVIVTRGSTWENEANLPAIFLKQLKERYEGTRIGRQELYAEILTDTPGALWTYAIIEACRAPKPAQLQRIVVAIDPAVTSGEDSDETGIIVAGKGMDGHFYVLEDATMRGTPDEWISRTIALFRTYSADRIVAEVNNGGDMIESLLRTVDRNIPFTAVRATRGKLTRAEPVSALYEQGRAHHCGTFPQLEDQMCSFTPDTTESPDRLDAMVWAAYELVVRDMDLQIS